MFLKSVPDTSDSVLLFPLCSPLCSSFLINLLHYLNPKICLNRSTVSTLCKAPRKRTQHCWPTSYNFQQGRSTALIREKISPSLRTLAEAYIRRERNHFFENGLHMTRIAGINGSRLSSWTDRSSDDVVCFGASRNLRKAKRLALVWKIVIFYIVFLVSN